MWRYIPVIKKREAWIKDEPTVNLIEEYIRCICNLVDLCLHLVDSQLLSQFAHC